MYVYDLKGALVWKKDFGVQMRMKMAFGEGMGPVIADDKLLLVFDHEGDSFMVALDKATGKEIWRVARAEKTNWAAPLVVDFKGRKQVVVAATSRVRSYDLRDGSLIGSAAGLGMNTIPHPVRQDDLVLVMSGYQNPKLMAIRLGREGDSPAPMPSSGPRPRRTRTPPRRSVRQQVLRAHGQRHAELLQRPHGRTVLPG